MEKPTPHDRLDSSVLAHYVECIDLQLSEIDMLKSMFPEKSEFSIDEDKIKEMKSFVEKGSGMPPRMEYSIHLSSEKGKVSLYAALPPNYPHEFPDIYVRSNQFSRQTQLELNSQLNTFLDSFEEGDLRIGSAIAWLQERMDDFLLLDQMKGNDKNQQKEKKCPPKDQLFLRLWIYSHHIYSKVKRKDILDLADEYQLTGFCLPGKPGIICVEGLSNNVNDWWHTVRSWNWQKILCKKQEEKKLDVNNDESKYRRFEGFSELGPDSSIRIKSSGFHVDMGDLYRYLEVHHSAYMFEEYFGVSGR